ncbi:unnamed protein product [Merluccius merluccius]
MAYFVHKLSVGYPTTPTPPPPPNAIVIIIIIIISTPATTPTTTAPSEPRLQQLTIAVPSWSADNAEPAGREGRVEFARRSADGFSAQKLKRKAVVTEQRQKDVSVMLACARASSTVFEETRRRGGEHRDAPSPELLCSGL